MKVTYSESASEDLVRQATRRLEEVLGPSADVVSAEWDRTIDGRGRPLYLLRLSDWTGDARAAISAEELSSPHLLSYRLHSLWGDLLQKRNHIQLKELSRSGE